MANMGMQGVRPGSGLEIKQEIKDLMKEIGDNLDNNQNLDKVKKALEKIKADQSGHK
jgi:hypothetical protein